MKLTRAMRLKYQKQWRQFGGDHCECFPPGGADVEQLCDLADDLLAIVRSAQCSLTLAQQQEVEKQLWLAERGRK